MEKCIEIFSRLIIATITFVVPIIINLLSTFADGEKRRKELAKKLQEEIDRQVAEEVQNNPANVRETIDKTSKKYKEIDINTTKELRLLNPIIQFWYIFGSLAISLIFLLISFLVRSNTWGIYNHVFSIVVLAISNASYLVALFFIIRILYTINKTKKII